MSATGGTFDLLVRRARLVDRWNDGTRDLGFRGGELVAIERSLAGDASQVVDAEGGLAVNGLVEAECDLDSVGDEAGRLRLGRSFQAVGITTLIDHGARLGRDGDKNALEQRAARIRGEFPQRVSFIASLDPRGRTGFDLERAIGLSARNADGSALGSSDLDSLFALAARRGLPILARPFDATDLSRKQIAALDDAGFERRTSVAAEIESVERLIERARTSGTTLVLTPLASAAAVDRVEDAVREGVPIRAGTSVVYLRASAPDAPPRRVPPHRGGLDRQRLTQAVDEGTISLLTSSFGSLTVSARNERLDRGSAQPELPMPLPGLVTDLLAIEQESGISFARLFALCNDGVLDAFGSPREPRLALGAFGDLFLFDAATGFPKAAFLGSLPHSQ